MTARNGFNLGSSVIHRLRNMHHFTVERNDDWDNKNFLDFVVFYIPNLQRIQSTGVQMTSKLDDHARMSEFVETNTGEARLVDRILYIEVDPALQLEGPGGDMVAFVIRHFQMDRSWQHTDAAGARLFSNMTYEMFNLRDAAGRSNRPTGFPASTSAGSSSFGSSNPSSGSVPSASASSAASSAATDPSELVRALQHRRTQITG